ncbi:uncharacterized protein LOC143032884 isoform X2 [Oratosquilla oratoria]|uniref:uncharacterized protein LOC143032884 isoform X2 n=1 Tax=Oratosquilla oratoria TaxID=337810 RepID=UPI003F760491
MIMLLKFLCQILLLASSCALNTFLNVEELESLHYAIDIMNKPVLREQVWEGEVMTVINKHGQEYICSLPNVPVSEKQTKKDENILDQLVDISVLLRPMETAPCLVKTKDWWTYEFCYGSVIKQYHLEDNKAQGPILILGKYESEYNWKNSTETKNRLQRFHSQFYVNGTKCDITGEPRRAEVRFHCEEGVGDYIQRVDEPESCRYVVTVATTRVCHHPYLKPHPSQVQRPISCAPVLTQEQYDRYLRYQQKKTEEELKEKQQWIEKHKDLMKDSETTVLENLVNQKSEEDEEDDDFKMNIKILRLPSFRKQKKAEDTSQEDITKDVDSSSDTQTEKESMEKGESSVNEDEVEDIEMPDTTSSKKDNVGDTQNYQDELSDSDSQAIVEEEKTKTAVVEEEGGSLGSLVEDVNLAELLKKPEHDNIASSDESLAQDQNSISLKELDQMQRDLQEVVNELEKKIHEYYNEDEVEEEEATQEQLTSAVSKLMKQAKQKTKVVSDLVSSLEKLSRGSASTEDRIEQDMEGDEETAELSTFSEDDMDDFKDLETEDGSQRVADKKEEKSISPRHLRIMKDKAVNAAQKAKIEQSIKERLQKSGLDSLGSGLQSNVFHSLENSGNAEELEERENHQKLEKNYNFHWDESRLQEEEEE